VTESNRRGERAVDDEFDDAFEADVDDTAARTASRSRSAPAKAKPPTRPRTSTADRGGLNPFGRLIHFIREVVAELQKVIWPTRKELITYSTVVIVFVTVITTLVSLLDLGFAKIVLLVFGS
jgi:preprotein translocase subunit SecE